MHSAFKTALDAGYVEPALLPDGSPLIVNGIAYYQASDGGINMLMKRFHAFGDVLRKHDTLRLSDETLTAGLRSMRDMMRQALRSLVSDTDGAMDCLRESLTVLERIEQRRALGLDVSQVYDIASIWHFSEHDDPGDVNPDATRRFIQDCLNAPNAAQIYTFFLGTPLRQFVPLERLFDPAIRTYIRNLNEMELLDWTRMIVQSQTLGLTDATISTIESRKETLFGFDGLLQPE